MAFTVGNKTVVKMGETLEIEVLRIISNPNATGIDSCVYKHINNGSPRQEISMSETIFNSEGWQDSVAAAIDDTNTGGRDNHGRRGRNHSRTDAQRVDTHKNIKETK